MIAILLIVLGTFVQSLVMIRSGIVGESGMSFWGPNAHDGLWHISLINQLSRLDFSHPTFSGFPLTNYHFGFDLFAGVIHALTRVSPVTIYFQLLPPLFSLITGILLYKLISESISNRVAQWALFFTYFGGSLGFLVPLFGGSGGGESAFWSIQSISFPINPPFMLSVVIMFAIFISFKKFLRDSPAHFFISAILVGILPMIKIYTGVVVLSSLFVVSLLTKNIKLLKLFLLSLLLSLILFVPLNSGASSLIKFEPLWFPRTMMQFPDRVGWERFSQARQAYMESKNYIKWIPAEILAVIIFVIGNLGTRIIGTAELFRKKDPVLLLISVAVSISILPTLLFVQTGNPWNIIQFFYLTEIFLGILAAVAISKIKSRYIWLGIILLTLPTTLNTLKYHYLPSQPPSAVPPYELKALDLLKNQPEGIVLTRPFDRNLFGQFTEPRPLYAYESTAYVSALSGHKTFLEDEVNLEISAYPWRERKQKVLEFFLESDNQKAKEFLDKNNIDYIYYVIDVGELRFGSGNIGFEEIYYEPHGVRILKRVK